MLKFLTAVCILVHSGAEGAYLAKHVCLEEQLPVIFRDVAEFLLGYTGHSVLGTEETCLLPTYICGDGFCFTIPKIEVVNMVGDHNLIISET